jgi:hypothetical protein
MKKISNLELEKLVGEGNGVSEIARKLGVTKGAISKRLKALNVAIAKDVTLFHAGEIVEKRINTIEQLQKINDAANELLDSLRKVKVRGSKEKVTEYKLKDPRELALKAMAEIRGQLSLQLEIFKTLYDVEAIAEFQREVLTIIGEVSDDIRNSIIQRLKESRALRSSVSIN